MMTRDAINDMFIECFVCFARKDVNRLFHNVFFLLFVVVVAFTCI